MNQKRDYQSPVTAVEFSRNTKIGPCSCTMSSQASCPRHCPFLGEGCYAESGPQGCSTARLNRSTETDPAIIAGLMADAMAGLTATRPLRLNVVGDARTNRAAKILAKASALYTAKYTQKVWTYSHGWRRVARKSWGAVSILASCETAADVKAATEAGYATALVVARFKDVKTYVDNGTIIIPCPQQTGKSANCTTCRLCWDADGLLARGMTIGFEAHGARPKVVREMLIQLGGA